MRLKELGKRLELEKRVEAETDYFSKARHEGSSFFKFSKYQKHFDYEILQEKQNLDDSLALL